MSYFRLTALTDLADVFANTRHGVHAAAAGSTWMALVYGFAGLREFDGHIQLTPRLPSHWHRPRFSLCIRDGERLELAVHQKPITVRAGAPVTVNLRDSDA